VYAATSQTTTCNSFRNAFGEGGVSCLVGACRLSRLSPQSSPGQLVYQRKAAFFEENCWISNSLVIVSLLSLGPMMVRGCRYLSEGVSSCLCFSFFSCFSKRISWVCCALFNENVSGARSRRMMVLRAMAYFTRLVCSLLLACDVLSFRVVGALSYYEWSYGPRSFLRTGRAVVVSPEPADSNSVDHTSHSLFSFPVTVTRSPAWRLVFELYSTAVVLQLPSAHRGYCAGNMDASYFLPYGVYFPSLGLTDTSPARIKHCATGIPPILVNPPDQ
jgi:hypothetical protein